MPPTQCHAAVPLPKREIERERRDFQRQKRDLQRDSKKDTIAVV
jgi:hypothetical protein